jgi:sirohydrochlorin cobaltochelatase
MTTALVLAGHGSHISPNTAGVVWDVVDQLRALRVADEVTAAFWKETPSFHSVLDTLISDDVTIVPLFTARGYFTRTVIPTEMGLQNNLSLLHGRVLRHARTLGEHPYLSQIVRRRVEGALEEFGLDAGRTAVAVIGHGTMRSVESRIAAEEQATILRASSLVAEVVSVYLDDKPSIPDVYTLTSAPHLIAVPYFVASGSHTTLDLPGELGLGPRQTVGEVDGRSVYYTSPVGDTNSLCDLALDLAREAGAPLYPARDCSPWDSFPAAGRDLLVEEVLTTGSIQFGQLSLTPSNAHVIGDQESTIELNSPTRLRAKVRERPFRPLPTTRDLRGGWRVEIRDPSMLHAVVETVYPGAVADWAANRQGAFRSTGLADVAARQTGMFRQLKTLEGAMQSLLVADVCGSCVRHPTWYHGSSPADAIPCAEPCNYWMSKARKSS